MARGLEPRVGHAQTVGTRQREQFALRPLEDISLVRKPSGESLFVQWSSVTTFMARKIHLDDLHRLKAIVTATNKPVSYADAEVIIKRTGAVNKRAKYKEGETHIKLELAVLARLVLDVEQCGHPWLNGMSPFPKPPTCV